MNHMNHKYHQPHQSHLNPQPTSPRHLKAVILLLNNKNQHHLVIPIIIIIVILPITANIIISAIHVNIIIIIPPAQGLEKLSISQQLLFELAQLRNIIQPAVFITRRHLTIVVRCLVFCCDATHAFVDSPVVWNVEILSVF